MKTSIDIPDAILAETMANEPGQSQEQSVVLALTDYNRRRRLARLVSSLGRSETFMTIEELMAERKADAERTY